MAIQSIEMTIDEIQEVYGIKTSTAYKWRKWLRDNDLEVSRENCDRINNRELVMTESVSIVQSEPEPQQYQPDGYNPNQLTPLGITVGRLQEINSQVELEVEVTERLRELHQSNRQSVKAAELQQRIQEVQTLDPKNLGTMLSQMGILR
jgi:transposase